MPSQQTFVAGPDWKEFSFPFSAFSGTDGRDMTSVSTRRTLNPNFGLADHPVGIRAGLQCAENIGTLHNAVADYGENEHRLIKRCQVMADFVFSEEFRSTLGLTGSLSPEVDEVHMTLPADNPDRSLRGQRR